MSQQFAPVGADATQTFALNNEANEAVAIQIFVVKREVAPDGTETLTPADADFLVFPPQVAIPAGKSQLIQVRWLGTRTPATELTYRVIAEQLPVALVDRGQTGGRLEILMRYEGAIYITPPNAAPNVAVASAARVDTPDGPRMAVSLRNSGTAHGLLDQAVLTVAGTGADGRPVTKELRGEDLGPMASPNILAGNKRDFLLAWPEGLNPQGVTATLRTSYVR